MAIAKIELRHLKVTAGDKTLVDTTGFSLNAGEAHLLVGASGSGKTLTARSLLGIMPAGASVDSAELIVTLSNGKTLNPYAALPSRRAVESQFRALRGGVIGYLPQDARGSLDPLMKIGNQVSSCLSLSDTSESVDSCLVRSGFDSPRRVASLYPHELSGGMAQRAGIAMLLARGSKFVIADEPTTGLDPTVQEGILIELSRLRDSGVGILLITHDLRIVPRLADKLSIMHKGQLTESSTISIDGLDSAPARALWKATARISGGVL
jgi:ABC-type dipeptide/oligopeptide/nickel transport system ATPase component